MLLTRVKSGKPARKSRSAELCARNGPANKHANTTAAATLAPLRVLERGGAKQAPNLRSAHGPSSSFIAGFMAGLRLLRGPGSVGAWSCWDYFRGRGYSDSAGDVHMNFGGRGHQVSGRNLL